MGLVVANGWRDMKALERLKIPNKLKVPDVFRASAVGLDIDRGAIKAVQVSRGGGSMCCSTSGTASSR